MGVQLPELVMVEFDDDGIYIRTVARHPLEAGDAPDWFAGD
jgi:hypothetical protein